MRTTLDLPDALFEEAKACAVQAGVTLEELLVAYIEAGLGGERRFEEEMVVSKHVHSLPIAWAADGTVTPARSNEEMYAILEEEEVGGLAGLRRRRGEFLL